VETGDETLDFVLQAGPRGVTPDTPEHLSKRSVNPTASVRFAGAQSDEAGERAKVLGRSSERAPRTGSWRNFTARHVFAGGQIWLIWFSSQSGKTTRRETPDEEDTLKYPGLRLNVKRGIHGQEYVK
jgi:hypothetical protein